MDSYFGEPNNMGNERVSGSSSRKGKKNNQEKPKQPQRGLGVAQLEKIRLHGEMAYGYHPPLHASYPSNFINEDPTVQTPYSSIPSSSFSYSSSSSPTSYSPASHAFQPNIVMGLPEYEKPNIKFGDSQPLNSARWEHDNAIAQPNITRPFLNLYDSPQTDTKKKHRSSRSMGSSSQNSESSDTQEPDLELRLSL